jgi:hypothetical protein
MQHAGGALVLWCVGSASRGASSLLVVCRQVNTDNVFWCAPDVSYRAGSDAFILSLGPYLAPAGSNLSLQFNYTASFGGKPPVGLLRSAAYPSAAGRGQEVVALATQFETSFARTVLPCLDEPKYKVRRDDTAQNRQWDLLLWRLARWMHVNHVSKVARATALVH